MRKIFLKLTMVAAVSVALVGCGKKEDGSRAVKADGPTEVAGLKTPAAFVGITDDTERSVALFEEMSKVMLHPRCANCHPKEGGPTQGDMMEAHNPPVIRGEAGMGAPGMECSTCHGSANVEFASMEGSIPGADPWILAPQSMGWVGATPAELCVQIKNPELNGGKTLQQLVAHNSGDHLVNWAWTPGEGRSPAPGDQATFGALTAAWVEAGAHCAAG